MSIKCFAWILLAVSSPAFGATAHFSGAETHLDQAIVDKYKEYDGKKISKLEFVGLRRTKEKALRWIVKSHEGTRFSSVQLALDVQIIANTGNLYNINPTVSPSKDNPDEADIVITVDDKWTLLPVFGGQGGGGSFTYGGGFTESNLDGYLINALALVYNYNGAFSYDVNFNQEYIAGTQTMAYIDWSNNIDPTIIHSANGSSAGNYTWQRQQEEVMVGTHWNGPIRPMIIGDIYYDDILLLNNVNATIYPGTQYRLQPKVIFGRSNIKGFLEEGYELTLHPSFANFFGPVQAYQSFDASYKQVFNLNGENNFAFFLFGGLMNSAPAPYEYEIGGYTNVRGYIDSRQVGPYTAFLNVEYRPFLFSYKFKFPDIDLLAVQGCFFTDAGSAWGDSTLTGDPGTLGLNFLWSMGLGLRLNFLHFAGAIIRIDLARTLHPDEGWGLSFGVGQFF